MTPLNTSALAITAYYKVMIR